MPTVRERGVTRSLAGVNADLIQAVRLRVGGADFPNLNGRVYYVDPNQSTSRNGQSWDTAFATMAEAFEAIASGDAILFRGNVREQLITPTGVADVTIIGAGNRPRHADTHPLNGERAASTWKLPAAGSTNNPLLKVRNPGWTFINFLVAAHASNYAFLLERTAIEDATEQDASHAEFSGVRFASGAGGISDAGGCFNVRVEGCHFQALTTACILGVGNIGVGQLAWEILNNHFNNFTNGVKIAGHECVIKGNFFTDGGTPNTTFVLNTNNGGGRDNFVVENYFQTLTANFNTPDIVGCATDVWNNVSIDGESGFIGREVGVPA
jgi:hypothetical protein